MKLEEAIEELKEYVRVDKEHRKTTEYNSDFDKFCEKHIEAIETVLQELEHLQKENEELKGRNKILESCKYVDSYEIIKAKQEESERWKDKIREKIDNRISTVENLLDEMIDKSIGCINVSCLNKKEKEEVIAKRNCLTVQKATLIDIKKDLLKEE